MSSWGGQAFQPATDAKAGRDATLPGDGPAERPAQGPDPDLDGGEHPPALAVFGNAPEDAELLQELVPMHNPKRSTIASLIRAAADARIKVVIRSDLPPADPDAV